MAHNLICFLIFLYIENAIDIKNVTASWEEHAAKKTLNEINLSIKPGQLCAVIGPVGSGKVSGNILQELST